jgi:hypothetical protein
MSEKYFILLLIYCVAIPKYVVYNFSLFNWKRAKYAKISKEEFQLETTISSLCVYIFNELCLNSLYSKINRNIAKK